MVLTDGVILEWRNANSSPKKPECLEKILDSGFLWLNQAVKMQLRLISFCTLIRCSGNFVTARTDLRCSDQRLQIRGWLFKVASNLAVILSKIANIFMKWQWYFSSLTSCSLIIFASNVTPMYIFLGLTSSILQIPLSTNWSLNS